ncbi:MAG: 50S ribosomal protein L18 [Candidatus Thermoplasmatota archaeon]|nr:50S ribosomal protein L18 [Candidatus Thermoplasmatota archaeon]MBS3789855.1 50S ribosomal protein L18 [Candidatus Thermoplasmatota archaeon]
MAEGSRYRMPLKRRKEGKTDYRQRLKLLKSGKPRAVVRYSNKHIRVQFIRYHRDGDRIEASASSEHLEDMGWKGHGSNLPSAYLVGYLAGKRASEKGIEEAVLDIGLNHPEKGGKLFSALNGIIDAGVSVPHDPEVLPEDERIKGKHIDDDMNERFEEVKSRLEEL